MSASPRILIAECMQEISSFNPVPSQYENFRVERRNELLSQSGLNTALGGAIPVFAGAGMEPVYTISARAGSAGLLSADGLNRHSSEISQAIAERTAKIAVVHFSLYVA